MASRGPLQRATPGSRTTEAIVHDGGRRGAMLHAVGGNARHRLRRTNADKRRAVELLLADAEWAAKSSNWIAQTRGVSAVFGRCPDLLRL